jgi:hypothetical protein
MAKRIVFQSQIELPVAASSGNEAVRKLEFDAHAGNDARHLPPGGLVGQVLVMTGTGIAWKYPHVVCDCGTGSITFQETSQGLQGVQGVDYNIINEVEIV